MIPAPAKYNLKIYAGATFATSLTWKAGSPPTPVNLTGVTARLQVRKSVKASTVLLEMTTTNGGIAIPVGTDGAFTMQLTDEQTSLLHWAEGEYQLEMAFPDGTVRRLLEGTVTVSPEITR